MARVAAIERLNASEVEVFQAVLQWAREECYRRQGVNCSSIDNGTMREIIEPFIYHIRFPSMGLMEFTEEVVVSGVLSAEEIALIYQQILATTPPPQSPFKSLNRGKPVYFPGDLILNSRNNQTRSASLKSHLRYSPSCFVNRNIILFKLHLLTPYSDASTTKITVEQNKKKLYNRTFGPASANPPERNHFGDNAVVSFIFNDSVHIDAGYFTVSFNTRQPKGYKLSSFEYSPGWQNQQNGKVEWWCDTNESPFYGFQYIYNSADFYKETASTTGGSLW